MLNYAIIFFVIAIIAAVLGFTSIAWRRGRYRQNPVLYFLVLTLVALVGGALRGTAPV